MSSVGRVPEVQPAHRLRAKVDRPRLSERIRTALDSGSLLLTAGAGFGKTTVLEQALEDMAAAWVPVTAAERDPGALLLRIAAGISRTVPGAGGMLGEALALPTGPIDPHAAARRLADELDRLLSDPLVVVVDDGERLKGAKESCLLLGALLAARPATLRLAIASRSALDLKVAKARAAGTLSDLAADELLFTAGECAEVLRGQLGCDPDGEQVDAIVEATGGWPLGVTLIAAAGGGVAGGDLRSADAVRGYLAEEVLDGLDPALRSAVLDAAVSSALTPAVTEGLGLPEDFLAEIERLGLALRGAYHPLLREFLLERLAAERSPTELAALHARVAQAVQHDGRPIDAIEHWLAAGRPEPAADALADAGLGLVYSSPMLLRSLVDRLPEAVRDGPGILLLEAQLAAAAGDHAQAEAIAARAIEELRDAGDVPREWMARFVLVEARYHLGKPVTAELVEGFDSDAARAAYVFAPGSAAAAAAAMAGDGRFEESDRLAAAVRAHPEGHLVGAAEAIRCAYLDLPRGNVLVSIERLRASLAELERDDPFGLRLYTMSWLGFMLEEAGRTDEVLAIARRLAEECADGLAPFIALHARNWRAQQNAVNGRLADAEADLALGGPATPGWLGYDWDQARAAVASLRGDAAEAVAAAERSLAQVRSGSLVFRFWAAADLVGVLWRAGRADRAGEVIEETLAMIDERVPGADGRFVRARMLALRAALRHQRGEQAAARADLLAAWEQAGTEIALIVRRQWHDLEPIVFAALESRVLPTAGVVAALTDAERGDALVALTGHPAPEVRRAALPAAIATGAPDAVARLEALAADPEPAVARAAVSLRAALPRTLPPLDVRLLGGFSVGRGTWRAQDAEWERPAAARLVRFLLVAGGDLVPEETILEALWPGLTADGARKSLRVAASRARRVLDPPGAEASALESGAGCYRLRLGERDVVDTVRFEAAASVALAERDVAARRLALERARDLWTGEPLPMERYSDWATAWREHLLDRHVDVLANLAALLADAGELGAAIEVGSELVTLDPINEGAHRLLMVAYARAGRTGQALRQFLVCRRSLVDELGIEPARETARLQARILAGEPV